METEFAEALSGIREEEENPEEEEDDGEEISFPESLIGKNGQFYRGTLRSGQKIEVDGSIVVLGDINPGAQIIAGGNVVVLGCLKGNVYAGYPEDRSAFVASLMMEPCRFKSVTASPGLRTRRQRNRRREEKRIRSSWRQSLLL